MQIRCLSFHAAYRCRHTGECCRAGWDIDVEPHIVDAVRVGRVLPLLSTPVAFELQVDAPIMTVARTAHGDCGFHNHSSCSLQHAGGESMLPSACRHFPRVFLRDGRGCLLTLSHFCPTAAAMLFDDGPDDVVEPPVPLALPEPIEGLDARDALPPLLRPGMLTDLEGYAAWETAVVQTLLRSADAEEGLTQIERATEVVRRWRPSDGPLTQAVDAAFAMPPRPASPAADLSRPFRLVNLLTGPHPLMDVPADFTAQWAAVHGQAAAMLRRPVTRYLAASAFGNWMAYRGRGLRSIAAWLRAGYDVLRVQLVAQLAQQGRIDRGAVIEAIRMADYIMVHTVDSEAFGREALYLEH